jgi:hypothetical protein
MSRVLRCLAVTVAVVFATAQVAEAAPVKRLDDHLAQLWTTVLETPSAQNSFGDGGQAFACFDLDGTVAPFAPSGVDSCTITTGTWLFVVASSVECSTLEANGTTEAELRACAHQSDQQTAPTVTLDGHSLAVSETETPLLNIVVPADNILGAPAGAQGQSVGHGWVTLVHPLTPGTHSVIIGNSVTTQIVVRPGR